VDDLAWLGIAEAGRRFRSGELSPTSLTRALLERIGRLDKHCNAFLLVTADRALAQAEQAGRELAQGRDRGPLQGIPYALKDIVDVAGLPTTCHSKILAANVAVRDAALVARLDSAGAVMIGKTAMHEFATGGPAFDLPWPPARNPWHRDIHPGGSSSGSGAAVAAGFVPGAVGTDTAGSIRNPATCCGLIGMKPTYGLVATEGVFPLAQSLDHAGPITRSVEDNALMLAAMAGRPAAIYVAAMRESLQGLRIGVIEHFYAEDASADVRMVDAIEAAALVLRELGADVQPVRLPPLSEWNECGRTIQQFEQYAVHREWLRTRPGDYCALSLAKLGAGESITRDEYERALQERLGLVEAYANQMQRVDAVITLSGLDLPCRLDDPQRIAGTYSRHLRMPFSLAGVPAMAVPTGFSDEGMPLGMQLAGARLREPILYRIAWAYCEATGWTDRHPQK